MNFLKKNFVFFNYSSLFKIKKCIFFDLLTKFNIYNFYFKPQINKIILSVNLVSGLKNETDIKIINSLNILDVFLDKKSEISDFLSKYLKKSKNIIFVNKSTLNNWYDIYTLFFCLKKIIIPNLKRKYVFLKITVLPYGFLFYIEDISAVANLSDDLKKERISVKLCVYFNKIINKKIVNFFINYFNLNIK